MLGAEGAGALTTAELMAGAGGSFVPTAGTGASFVLPETLAASSGALGGGTAAAAAPGYGINFGATGASGGINAGALGGSAGITAPSAASLQTAAGLGITEGSALAGTGAAAAKTASMTPMQKFMVASMASKALSSGSGEGGGGSTAPTSTTTTTSAPQQQYPQQQQLVMSPYMTPMSMNTSGAMYNPTIYSYNTRRAAQGGLMYQQGGVADLGGYAAGGKLLKGPGDGMSDDIVANIAGKQPARLADGEFVVPADVVSHLGNGSTDAGAKHLYKMMDRIRKARTGNPKQGKRINPNKFLPKE
jgi:hypothetical protein